jgi:hypothetical protein
MFWFLTYYTKPSVNYLLKALNEFNSKSCQLQSFGTFRDQQFLFRKFSIRGRLQNLNFKILKFKRNFA